jgi:hypothetical protein
MSYSQEPDTDLCSEPHTLSAHPDILLYTITGIFETKRTGTPFRKFLLRGKQAGRAFDITDTIPISDRILGHYALRNIFSSDK